MKYQEFHFFFQENINLPFMTEVFVQKIPVQKYFWLDLFLFDNRL